VIQPPSTQPDPDRPNRIPGPGDGHFPFLTDEERLHRMIRDFNDPSQWWRRLFAEVLGTFLLVLVAAGGPMVAAAIPGSVGRSAAVVAPGMMVMAVILFMGRVSGAHLNPAVSISFWLRRDFPGRRVLGYVIAQLAGACIAAWFLQAVIHVSARYGSTYAAPGRSAVDAMLLEAVLTLGLVSVVLGTASGAQQVGLFGALGVGAYVALAGLWASPISGASMNPARTFGPDLVAANFADYWAYVVGPLAGAVVAVAIAYVLRGPGGGHYGSTAAQGTLTARPGQGPRQ
jgi:aquaporin Z